MDIDGDLVDIYTYKKLKVKSDEIDVLFDKMFKELNILVGDN